MGFGEQRSIQPKVRTVKPEVRSEMAVLKKSLTIATSAVTGSVFLSRIVGPAHEQVIARRRGVSAEIVTKLGTQ